MHLHGVKANSESPSAAPAGLLDLDDEVLYLILENVDVQDLCNLSSSCKILRTCITSGLLAADLWHQKCQQLLGEGLVALHTASKPLAGIRHSCVWLHLYKSAFSLDTVRWWKSGSRTLQHSVEQVDRSVAEAERRTSALTNAHSAMAQHGLVQDAAHPPSTSLNNIVAQSSVAANDSFKSSLARSGHTGTLLGSKVAIVGGMLRDGSSQMDVLVMHLDTLKICRPHVYGTAPPQRCRHISVAVACPSPGSELYTALAGALPPPLIVEDGSSVLVIGGSSDSSQVEYSGVQLEALWLSSDGNTALWLTLTATGVAPGKRVHHSGETFSDGKRLIVYGGRGSDIDEAAAAEEGGAEGPLVHVLDVDALHWSAVRTCLAAGRESSPGYRALHTCTLRTAPVTGEQELVVVGGCVGKTLVNMTPYVLNLRRFEWRRAESPSAAGGAASFLPPPRQRAGSMASTDRWLLVVGGQTVGDAFLEDVQRLHLPTLTWRRPPRVIGQPPRALRRIAGHSAAGLVMFGGCIPTILGIIPVLKTDILLLGTKPPLRDTPSRRNSRTDVAGGFTPSITPTPNHASLASSPHPPPEAPGRYQNPEAPWRYRMKQKRLTEVAFKMANVKMRLWRDRNTGQLYASRPAYSDYSSSSSSGRDSDAEVEYDDESYQRPGVDDGEYTSSAPARLSYADPTPLPHPPQSASSHRQRVLPAALTTAVGGAEPPLQEAAAMAPPEVQQPSTSCSGSFGGGFSSGTLGRPPRQRRSRSSVDDRGELRRPLTEEADLAQTADVAGAVSTRLPPSSGSQLQSSPPLPSTSAAAARSDGASPAAVTAEAAAGSSTSWLHQRRSSGRTTVDERGQPNEGSSGRSFSSAVSTCSEGSTLTCPSQWNGMLAAGAASARGRLLLLALGVLMVTLPFSIFVVPRMSSG